MEQPIDSFSNIEIRSPEPRDVPEIRKLVSSCGPWLTPHHPYVFWLTTRCCRQTCAVAELAGELVGWVSIFPEPGRMFLLHQIAVAPALRHKGLGVSVVIYLLNKVREETGRFRVEFTIDRRNIAAKKLFAAIAARAGMRLVRKDERVELLDSGCEEELYELVDDATGFLE